LLKLQRKRLHFLLEEEVLFLKQDLGFDALSPFGVQLAVQEIVVVGEHLAMVLESSRRVLRLALVLTRRVELRTFIGKMIISVRAESQRC